MFETNIPSATSSQPISIVNFALLVLIHVDKNIISAAAYVAARLIDKHLGGVHSLSLLELQLAVAPYIFIQYTYRIMQSIRTAGRFARRIPRVASARTFFAGAGGNGHSGNNGSSRPPQAYTPIPFITETIVSSLQAHIAEGLHAN
jgi:hypothetical protein